MTYKKICRLRIVTIHTLSIMLPSTKTTLEPRNSFTLDFTCTRPEMMRAGRSSFTTGICAKKLQKAQQVCKSPRTHIKIRMLF